MCRNHRGFVEATLAAAKLGASALYLNTMFAGPQLAEVTRREGPKVLVYDEEFTGLLEGVDGEVARVIGWSDGGSRGADAGAADRRRRGVRPEAAARQTALRDPHLGHDRDAEGRPALQPRRPAGDRGADRQDPLPHPRDDDDRGAALSLLGLLPLHHEPADRLDDGAAAALRPRGHAARRAGKPRPGAGGGAGDDPAHPAAARGDARQLRPLLAADHLALRLGAAGRAGDRVDGPLRRHDLQPLRLDRGRLRDGRHPRGPARRARAPPAGRRAAPSCGSATRAGGRCRGARSGGSSSATRCPSRATPAAAARRSSTACSAAATSATSTPPGGSSSTAATTR